MYLPTYIARVQNHFNFQFFKNIDMKEWDTRPLRCRPSSRIGVRFIFQSFSPNVLSKSDLWLFESHKMAQKPLLFDPFLVLYAAVGNAPRNMRFIYLSHINLSSRTFWPNIRPISNKMLEIWANSFSSFFSFLLISQN